QRFAAASSLDGKGGINFYNYDFSTVMPADILGIEGKDDGSRTAKDKEKLREHYGSEVKLLGSVMLDAGQFAVRWLRDGSGVAVAGEDGKIRLIDAAEAKVIKEFIPVPIAVKTAVNVR
ncbi:MAG: hypothetical protein NTX04_08930, partial [Verrucomicrobia bacterium]|nr:hypothetical protein [Verrucomicrobiota bacterium]